MTTVDEPRITAHPSSWVPTDETFGARLALVRQRMGWGNLKIAATECGLPVETWRTWERDGVTPSRLLTVAQRIAVRTGCDYLWLVHGPDRGGDHGGGGMHTQRDVRRPAIGHVVRTVGEPVDHVHTRAVLRTRPVGTAHMPGVASVVTTAH